MTNPAPRRIIPLKLERTLTLTAAERKAILDACERWKRVRMTMSRSPSARRSCSPEYGRHYVATCAAPSSRPYFI